MFLKKLRGVGIVGRERNYRRRSRKTNRVSSVLLHFPTMCSTSFSFSVQTYSPMSSPASSSDARG